MLAKHAKAVLTCMGIVVAGTISVYVILIYMPTFASTQLHLPLGGALRAQSIALACMIFAIPVFGALSDRIGRKPIMIGALALYLGLLYPLFSWVYANPSLGNLMVMQIVLSGLIGAFFGPFATALAEQFPAYARSTGLAVAYNVPVMAFGGFAQFFVTWLINATGSPIAPVFYVIFGAATALAASCFLVERKNEI